MSVFFIGVKFYLKFLGFWGCKELLGKNNVGILIEPGDSKILLKKIIELTNDEELRQKISFNAFEEVQKYDWSNIGKRYVDLYHEVLHS